MVVKMDPSTRRDSVSVAKMFLDTKKYYIVTKLAKFLKSQQPQRGSSETH